MVSVGGTALSSPWLPYANMLASAHMLGLSVYAGEVNIYMCCRAIEASKLRATPIEPNYVAELVG